MRNCMASILLLFAIYSITDSCRTLRPRSLITTPRPRPVYQRFETHKCPPDYAAWYCLNNATCFAVKMGAEVLYNCECSDSFIGPRCDYKYFDLNLTTKKNHSPIMLETASVTRGAFAVLLIIFGIFVLLKTQSRKTNFRLKDKISFAALK